jgi:repressor LexA
MSKNFEVGRRIKQRRTEIGITQEELGNRLHLNKSTIQRYESGAITSIKLPIIQAIAKQLNVSPEWLALKTDEIGSYIPVHAGTSIEHINNIIPLPETKEVPLLGTIACGEPILAEENIEDYIYTELNGGNEYFGLRVEDDSMNAARICEGDIIIVRQQEQVEDGEIAVVMVGDQNATVKRFHREGRNVFLTPQSYNPVHKVQVYDLKETNIRIVGKVVQVVYRME